MIEPALAGLGLGTYLFLAAICFVAAIVGGMSGFGSGLIISAAVAPLVGVKAVVPLIAVVMTVTNAARIWAYSGALDGRKAILLLATSVPAAVLGALVYVRLDPNAVSLLLGLVLIASAPLNRWLRHRRFHFGERLLLFVGALFGFLSSNVIGAGLLIPPVLIGAGLLGPAVLATDAAIAVATSLFRVLAFGALDALTPPLAFAGCLMGLCTVPGTWCAAWAMRHTSLRLHTALIEFFIVAAGLGFVWRGLFPA